MEPRERHLPGAQLRRDAARTRRHSWRSRLIRGPPTTTTRATTDTRNTMAPTVTIPVCTAYRSGSSALPVSVTPRATVRTASAINTTASTPHTARRSRGHGLPIQRTSRMMPDYGPGSGTFSASSAGREREPPRPERAGEHASAPASRLYESCGPARARSRAATSPPPWRDAPKQRRQGQRSRPRHDDAPSSTRRKRRVCAPATSSVKRQRRGTLATCS